MSGLKRRLSRRRSAGPEGTDPSTAAAPGSGDTPAQTPAEAEGHTSLLNDPAAQTRVVGPGEASYGRPDAYPPVDPATGAYPAGGAYSQPTGYPQPDAGAYPGGYPQPAAGAYPQPYPVAPVGDYPRPGPGGAPQPAYFTTGQAVPGAPYSVRDPADPDTSPFADLPPGLDPDELAAAPPTSARRSRLRRRVAFLRAARELLMRDLGGFIYELHRTASDIESEAHRYLRATKLDRLTRLDAELHALELRLNDVRRNVIVREPGVGGECPQCGELFGSDDHYCSHCGLPLTESARRAFARVMDPNAEPAPEASAVPLPVLVRPGEFPRAGADQATQPIPALDTGAGTEFRWPPRDPAPGGEPATGGAATPSGDAVTGEPPAGDQASPATGAADDASGDDDATRAITAGDDSTGQATEAATGTTPTAGDDVPAGDDATGTTPTAGDDVPAGDDSTGQAPDAGGEAATGDGGDVAGATPAAGDHAPTGDVTDDDDDDAATVGDDARQDAGGPKAAEPDDDARQDAGGPKAAEPDDDARPDAEASKDDDSDGRGGLFSRAERGV